MFSYEYICQTINLERNVNKHVTYFTHLKLQNVSQKDGHKMLRWCTNE